MAQPGGAAQRPYMTVKSCENWAKTILITQLVDAGERVLDLQCGRGQDIGKWERAKIASLLAMDPQQQNVDVAREKWQQKGKPFAAEFEVFDAAAGHIEDVVHDLTFHAVFCAGPLERSFASEESARALLKNAALRLRSHGFLFGSMPDSSAIWYRAQKSSSGVRGEGYSIRFEGDFLPFGTRATIKFDDGAPATSDYLVHFPTLIRLGREYGLKLIEATNLLEFFEDHKRKNLGMLVSEKVADKKGRLLHKSTAELLGLYTTFVFQKVEGGTGEVPDSPAPPSSPGAKSHGSPPAGEDEAGPGGRGTGSAPGSPAESRADSNRGSDVDMEEGDEDWKSFLPPME
eukprot:tig00020943_g16270.t1